MKIICILLLFLESTIWSSYSTADDYPGSYINRQLVDARTPIEVKVTNLRPGQLARVEYVDRPVWMYRRTPKDLEYLLQSEITNLADPKSENFEISVEATYGSSSSYVWAQLLLTGQPEIENTPYRSKNEQFFIVAGWSPHSGCTLNFYPPENRSENGVAFYDPCVGASFDVAGRILKGQLTGNAAGVPARYNLYIPPYRFKDDGTLVVGIAESRELPKLQFSKEERYLAMNPTERLITASRYDDLETVRQALKDGANASYFKAGKGSPLDAAIIGSSIEVINLLIANGAKPTQNSLNAAELVGRAEVVRLINEMQ